MLWPLHKLSVKKRKVQMIYYQSSLRFMSIITKIKSSHIKAMKSQLQKNLSTQNFKLYSIIYPNYKMARNTCEVEGIGKGKVTKCNMVKNLSA